MARHTDWIEKAKAKVTTSDGRNVDVFELNIDMSDAEMLTKWAKQFREHYCLDAQLDRLRKGTGKSRSDYLLDLVFPDKSNDFGPATRAGDFAEILIADLIESRLGFWVPRTRYHDKLVRNESPKGTDVLGFKFKNIRTFKPSKTDTLITVESKAQLTGRKPKPRLQHAVEHSAKDVYRIAESLNAMKQRVIDRLDEVGANKVERFQDGLEIPYIRETGAAAVFCSSIFDQDNISSTTNCAGHENEDNLVLMVVHSEELMKFVHYLYERAANEA